MFREPILDALRHNFEVLSKYGVTIAIGSDQFRSTSVQEALEIHKSGLMPAAVLSTQKTCPETGPGSSSLLIVPSGARARPWAT